MTKHLQQPLSVLICARNELDYLKQNLPKVLLQDYAQFEVIVVNDRSSDASLQYLLTIKEDYSNLQVINIPDINKNNLGKKHALKIGIERATNEYLVFTDADCYPVSKNWLKHICTSYNPDIEIVIAYGAYEAEPGFLNKLIRFDTVFIAMQYMSSAKIGHAYMGVGRNLSYRKSSFLKIKGFDSHIDILSGDDDLLVNQLSAKKNTKVLIDRESITVSQPKKTFKEYVHQKRRHLETGKFYKKKHKFMLGFEVFSRFIFYLSAMLCVFSNLDILTVILLGYVIRLIIQFLIIGIFSKRLNEKKILIFIPIFDIFIPLFNLYLVLSNHFIKNLSWK